MRLLAVAVLTLSLFPDFRVRGAEPTDPKSESPAKPAPSGLKYLDQGQNDPRLKGYRTPEGFKLEIVTAEPTLVHPARMTFGPDGALHVLERRTGGPMVESRQTIFYKDGSTRSVTLVGNSFKSVVKKLTHDAATGLFSSAKSIMEDDQVSAILIHDGWLYVAGRGTVRRSKLAEMGDGSDKRPAPQVIARGFAGDSADLVSGLSIGSDGDLYITAGAGDHIVEGSDGSRATLVRTGGVFRCRPDGSRIELFARGLGNVRGDLAFDRRFNAFHLDNDTQSAGKPVGCRLLQVAEEADFGWRLRPGMRAREADPVRGAVAGELPGKLAPMGRTAAGTPAGLFIYNDAGWPEFYRNWLLSPDSSRHAVRAFRTAPVESSFEVTQEFDLIQSDDRSFQPTQLVAGPDGAVYLCDAGDGVSTRQGRIYRLTWTGGVLPETGEELPGIPRRGLDAWAKIIGASDAELLKSLASESLSDRRVAGGELVRRGVKNRPAVLAVLSDPNAGFDARAASLGALESMWNDEVRKAVLEIFDENEGDLKRLGINALSRHANAGDVETANSLVKLLGDHDRSLQRAASLALGRLNPPGIGESIVACLRTDKGSDPSLTDAYLRTLERLGKPGLEALLDLGRSGKDADRDRCVTTMLGARAPEALAVLPDLLADPHLSSEQRASLIASATNYQFDPPAKIESLIQAIGKRSMAGPAELAAIVGMLAETGHLTGELGARHASAALECEQQETRLAAMAAIHKAKLESMSPGLLRALEDGTREVPERVTALKTLSALKSPGLGDAIVKLLKTNPPTVLRAEALRTLSTVDPAALVPLAMESLESADTALQHEAVQLLGATPAGSKMVGQRYLDKKLPRELLPVVSDALRKLADQDPVARKMLVDVMRSGLLVSMDPAQAEKVRQMVLMRGDAARGRALYLHSAVLACVQCHQLEGVGGRVGPDLTRFWDSASIDKIIESLLDPSREIKEGFQAHLLITKDGRPLTGLKISETPAELVLRDSTGADIRVPRADIRELTISKTSLMPAKVVTVLTFDQFIDLVAFLKNRPAQEALRGVATDYLVRGPVPAGAKQPEIMQLKPQPVSTQPGGTLNLRKIYPTGDLRVFAEARVFSPKAQTVTLWLGSDGPTVVTINGKPVGETHPIGLHAPESDRLRVPLSEGWNSLGIETTNRGADFRLSLRVQGADVRVAAGKN